MKTLYIFFITIFCIISETALSQRESDNWYFGNKAGASFQLLPPSPLLNSPMQAIEGCASISDANGNLLFYTDGIKVWNRTHHQMPNGFGLNGDPSSTSVLIVPKPGYSSIYYIFTTDDIAGPNGVCYSTVDISLDSSRGDITNKNNLLYTPSTEKLAAVKHSNGQDIWVVTHRWNSNEFYTYLVNSSGVQTNIPVISAIGETHSGSSSSARGYMKGSPSGNKIALAIEGMNKYEIFDFNKSTGKLTNCIALDNNSYEGAYGVEFSYQGRYLYTTERWNNKLWRFDLNAGYIPGSVQQITTLPTPFGGALQLARDRKIYLARAGSQYLGLIENPDDANPIYTDQGFSLAGKESYEGLPSFITSSLSHVCFAIQGLCFGDTTHFNISNASEIASVHWNFEYPSADANNQSTLVAPTHFYNSGSYTIQLIAVLNSGVIDTVWRNIAILPAPVIHLSADTSICPGTSIDAGPGFYDYHWSNNTHSRILYPTSSGTYSVTVINANNCDASDSIHITMLPAPLITYTSTNISTPGGNNGSINASISGGTAPFTYLWSNAQNTLDISNLYPGCYTLTVSDQHLCKSTQNICLNGPHDCSKPYAGLDWVKAFHSKNFDANIFDIAIDNNGFIYATGKYSDTLQIENTILISKGGVDIFTAKFNSNGQLIWIRSAGGIGNDVGYSILIDKFNNIYIGGNCIGICYFSNTFFVSCLSIDGFYAKYDSAGNFIMAKNFGGIDFQNAGKIRVDNLMNIYIAGTFQTALSIDTFYQSTYGLRDIFIVKLDSSGNFKWAKTMGGDDFDALNDFTSDSLGNLYVTGNFKGLFHLDSNIIQSTGGYDIFLVKFSSFGEIQWLKKSGGIYDDFNSKLTIDNIGNIFLASWFGSNIISFSDTSLNFFSNNNAVILKYNSNAVLQKIFPLTRININSIQTDNIGNFYLCGYFHGIIAFDSISSIGTSGSDMNIFLAKWNNTGSLQWVKSTGGIGDDRAYSMALNNSGEIFIGGFYSDTATFDTTHIETQNTGMFLAKYSEKTFKISAMNITGLGCNADSICIKLNAEGGNLPYQYHWSNGATTKDICHVHAGQYSVFVTDALGCSVDSAKTVYIPSAMSLQISGTNVTIPGSADGSASLVVSGGQPPYTYHWNNGSTLQNLTNIPAGNYFVTVNDALTCQAISNIIIIQPDNPLQIQLIPLSASCTGSGMDGSIQLSVSGGIPPYLFSWSNGAATQNVSNLSAGWYSVTISDGSSPQYIAIDSIHVIHDTSPVVNLGNDTTICEGGYTLLNAENTGASYNWSTGAISQIISVNKSGTYAVTVTNSCGSVTDSITISIENGNLSINLGIDTTLCGGESITLNAGNTGAIYLWSTGETSEVIHVNTTGLYSVSITNCSGTISDSRNITFSKPEIHLGNDITIFDSDSLVLDAGSGHSAYFWNTGAVSQTILISGTAMGAGTFTFTAQVTDNFNCTNSDTIIVTIQTYINVNSIDNGTACIKTYPNPSNGIFVIEKPQNSGEIKWEISSSLCKKELSGTIANEKTSLDLSTLSKGIYILKLSGKNINSVMKLIIQ